MQALVSLSVSFQRLYILGNCSRWTGGLAIHKTARMIAVSSNTHKVLVFAFALDSHCSIRMGIQYVPQRYDEDRHLYEFGGPFNSFLPRAYLQSSAREEISSGNLLGPPWTVNRQHHHIVIGLIGHDDNVPNIAFWNSPSQSLEAMIGGTCSKIYLASIDIVGTIYVWNVCTAQKIFKSTCREMKFNGRLSTHDGYVKRVAHIAKVDAAGVWLVWIPNLRALYRSALPFFMHSWIDWTSSIA